MNIKWFIALIFIVNIHTCYANCNISKLLESASEAESFLKITCPLLNEKFPEAKNHANEILASQLAEKIKQRFENISAVETYYSSNGLDLGKIGSTDMMKSCTISKVENSIANNSKCSSEKLIFLKKALGGKTNDSIGNILGQKYTKIRNLDSVGNAKGQCPLADGSTKNQLAFTMDESAKNNFKILMGAGTFSTLRQMPIFDIIPKDKEEYFREKFKSGLSLQNNQNDNSFVDQFLKNTEYVTEVTKNLGKSCDDLFKNITDYACQEFDPIPKEENNFKNIVKGDSNSEFQIVSTCHYLDNAKVSKNGTKSIDNQSVDQLLTSINSNLRSPPTSQSIGLEATLKKEICSIYNCSNTKLSEYASCKNGKGPISSTDLNAYCEEADCDESQTQFIKFLANFENEQKRLKSAIATSNSKDEAGKDLDKNSTMSIFNMNFLGIEGALVAEGKPITPEAIAAKKTEFKESGIMVEETASKSQSRQDSQAKVALNAPSVQAPVASAVVASNANFEFHPSVVDSAVKTYPTESLSNSDILGGNQSFGNRSNPASQKSAADSDLENLRKKMDQMIDGISGTNKDKIQAITDNNLAATSKNFKDNSGLNDYEANRLEDYRRRLESWDRDLQRKNSDLATYENDLKSKAFRADNPQISTVPVGSTPVSAISGDKSTKDSKGVKSSLLTSGADNTEAIVDSVDLPKVDKEMLAKAGINMKSSFFIKVKYENRFVEVPVKIFTVEGKEVLVPILDSKNKLLNQSILSSPLFKDYLVLQKGRAQERTSYQNALL